MLIVSALYGARSQEFHSSRHMCCDDVTIKVICFDFYLINEKKLAHFTALCSAGDCIHRKIQMLLKLFQVCLCSCISIVCLNSALCLSERCSLLFSFLHMHLINKRSVKSISHLRVERGTNAGLIVTLYKHFHMLA